MPDWSYHTLFKPILMGIPAIAARRLILSAVSLLGAIPGGRCIIDFMGHMHPSEELSFSYENLNFPSRVGLGSGISNSSASLSAFEHFGFGFLEIGPVTLKPIEQTRLDRDSAKEAIIRDNFPANEGLEAFAKNCLPGKKPSMPLLVRIAHASGINAADAVLELESISQRLPVWVDALVLDTCWSVNQWSDEELNAYLTKAKNLPRKIMLALAADTSPSQADRYIRATKDFELTGISITGGITDPGTGLRVFGRPTFEMTLSLVKRIRTELPTVLLIAGNGVIEPIDAQTFLDAGADLVSVYSGLVYSGPGLAKRINELYSNASWQRKAAHQIVDAYEHAKEHAPPYSIAAVLSSGWLGIAIVGFGLMITGASAITVALTTVILPYDEKFLGLTRQAVSQINSNLLPFLSHDRVTYAGAGMSCGLLFLTLSYFGTRLGQHWAFKASSVSCAFGFLSFLLFLGFHYLDPLHALVTGMLFPFFLWGILRRPKFVAMRSANKRNSLDWRQSLTGQCLFVFIGAGLILAGITICKVGTSTVFVKEDLMFMNTTAELLLCHNDHLLPAIAHDRAGFGGTLVTSGIAVLLTSLHGFRQGEGWIWWMLLIAGLPGFCCTLGIHFAIGYTSFIHLLPAYIAFIMFVTGLGMSYRYLCEEPGPDDVRFN